MRLGDYLADHASQLVCWLVTLLLAELLAQAAGLAADVCIVLAALLALGGAAALVLGYLRDRRFLRDLRDNAATLEHAWQLPLVIEEPDSRVGRLVFEALSAQGRSAADDVSESARRLSAYRSYIEAWIHEVKVPIAAAGLAASRLDVAGRAVVLRELDRINAQVEQALWYARSESAELDYTIREVPLARIVKDAYKDNARLLIESGVSVEVAIGEAQRVFTDAKWAAFVISQAVVNAAKYGARHVRASASVEGAGSTDEHTTLELADDGWGIPAADVSESARRLSAYRSYIEAWIHEVKVPIAAAGLAASRLDVAGRAVVLRELDRINAQVEQALWYARSESAELDYTIREVPLARIVKDAYKDNARLLIESGVSVEVAIGEAQRVFTDAKWAAFVISQAVVNAAKYGARHVRASASVEGAGSTDEHTTLELADDGWGIPAADVPHVFERGFTGENGHAQARSTGMGLYLAARICEKLGLGLEIASEEGTGTRMLVSFPHDRRRLTLAERAR